MPVELRGMQGQRIALSVAPGASDPASMSCPKCGFEQPESPECRRCGIFVSRFLEKARLEEETRIIQSSIAEKQAAYASSRALDVDDDGFFGPEKKGIENGMVGGIA